MECDQFLVLSGSLGFDLVEPTESKSRDSNLDHKNGLVYGERTFALGGSMVREQTSFLRDSMEQTAAYKPHRLTRDHLGHITLPCIA